MARIVKTEACATVNSTNGTALPEIRKSLLLKKLPISNNFTSKYKRNNSIK